MTETNRVTLHPRSVGALPIPAHGYYRTWDTVKEGLHVVVTSRGARVYRVRYRLPDNRRVDYVIGSVEDVGLAKAREKAEQVTEDAKTAKPGQDPQRVKVRARKDESFGMLADRCLDSLPLRPNTKRQWTGILKNHLRPRFGALKPADIERKAIREFIGTLGRKKPVLAARAYELMRRVFSWGVKQDAITGSPFVGLEKPEMVAHADAHERERTLNRAEVYSLFRVLQDSRFTEGGFDLYIRLLFETAVRRDEMLKAAWSEVDFGAGFFTVSQLRYKSKRPHQVPLSTAAVAALRVLQKREREKAALGETRELIRQAKRAGEKTDTLDDREAIQQKRLRELEASDYVFPGTDAKKARVSPQRAFEDLRKRVGFKDWTLHDIRRTVATELDRMGVAPNIREAILGHAPDKLTRTYSKHVPLLEMRQALQKWSERLEEIITTAPTVATFEAKEASA
jgi:integrase